MQKEIDDVLIMKLILSFLQLLMPQTLAKRITSMVLIAAGIPNERITALTGLCDRSVRSLQKALKTGEAENLFHVGGGGVKSKLSGYESAIIGKIESGSYTSRQQTANMIQKIWHESVFEHGFQPSKKRHQATKMWFSSRQS